MSKTIAVIPKFQPRSVAISLGAMERLDPSDVFVALARHLSGDWGDVGEEDWKSNDHALQHGFRLLSSYVDPRGVKFWIISEWDRSVTTVLLPDEY